jgi:hypothetical protein
MPRTGNMEGEAALSPGDAQTDLRSAEQVAADETIGMIMQCYNPDLDPSTFIKSDATSKITKAESE